MSAPSADIEIGFRTLFYDARARGRCRSGTAVAKALHDLILALFDEGGELDSAII